MLTPTLPADIQRAECSVTKVHQPHLPPYTPAPSLSCLRCSQHSAHNSTSHPVLTLLACSTFLVRAGALKFTASINSNSNSSSCFAAQANLHAALLLLLCHAPHCSALPKAKAYAVAAAVSHLPPLHTTAHSAQWPRCSAAAGACLLLAPRCCAVGCRARHECRLASCHLACLAAPRLERRCLQGSCMQAAYSQS